MAFLETMNHLMGVIQRRYDAVKQNCRDHGVESNDQILFALMECALAVHGCMDCVRTTWAELTLEHAHIRSLYDLLAVVFILPALRNSEECDKIFEDVLGFSNPKFPHLTTHFVGDVVECCFAVDGLDTSKALKMLGTRLGLPEGGWEKEEILQEAEHLARHVVDLVLDYSSNKVRMSFLTVYEHIGNGKCILNTFKILQQSFAYMEKGVPGRECTLAKAAANTFPFVWDENKHPTRRLRGDLDYLLAGQVLPELLAACFVESSLVGNSTGVERLVPLMHSLKVYVQQPFGEPVSVELAFGFHALLISILALQGDSHVAQIYEKGSKALKQVMCTLDQSSEKLYPSEGKHVSLFDFLRDVGINENREPLSIYSTRYAYWNPYFVGTLSLYGVYVGIARSVSFLDIEYYLRPVLHLYNALRSRGLVEKIEILELLDSIFWHASGIWMTDRSTTKGDFAKVFLVGTGFSIRDVSMILDGLKEDHGMKPSWKRYRKSRDRGYAFDPKMCSVLHSNQFTHGHAVLFWKDYSNMGIRESGETDDYDNDITDCEAFVSGACRALQYDIAQFGGSFLDLAGVAFLLKDFCKKVVQELDARSKLDLCIDCLGEIDFARDSSLSLAPRVATFMSQFFDGHHRDDFSFSNGL